MRYLIVYRSKYGTTEKCACMLRDRLGGKTDLWDLKEKKKISPEDYDCVIIGGPIYGGSLHPDVLRFCTKYRTSLENQEVALFICCLFGEEKARRQLDSAFPGWLALRAFTRRSLGGELKLKSLSLLDRFTIRRLTGRRENKSTLRLDAVDELANTVDLYFSGKKGR